MSRRYLNALTWAAVAAGISSAMAGTAGAQELAELPGLGPVSYTHLTLPTICSV